MPLIFPSTWSWSPASIEPPPNVGPAEAGVFRLQSGRRAGYASRNHQCDRDLVSDRTVWPNLIVVSTPILHLFAGIRKGQEPVLVQAFGSEAAVKRLDEGVVAQFPRACEVERDVLRIGPEVEIARHELGPSINTDGLGEPTWRHVWHYSGKNWLLWHPAEADHQLERGSSKNVER